MTEANKPHEPQSHAEPENALPLPQGNDFLRLLAEYSNDLIGLHDAEGRFVYASPACKKLLGCSPAELLAAGPRGPHRGRHDSIGLLLKKLGHLEQAVKITSAVQHRDGRTVWLETCAQPIFDGQGRLLNILSISRDVTERSQMERALVEAQKQMESRVRALETQGQQLALMTKMVNTLQICSEMSEAFAVVAEFMQVLFPGFSGALMTLDGRGDTLQTRSFWGAATPPFSFFSLDECWATRLRVPHLVSDTREGLVCRHVNPGQARAYLCMPVTNQARISGLLYLEQRDHALAPESSPQPLAAIAAEQIGLVLSNLSLRQNLRDLAIRDPLTGLYNRLYMQETLERELHRCEREQAPLSLLMIDIDHFKDLNDQFGHQAGDAYLRELGDVLAQSVRADDIACRFGGEEFLLILPGAALEHATRRAESLRARVAQVRVPYADVVIGPASLSIGVSTYPEHGKTSALLTRAADFALYHAKSGGRDRVCAAQVPGDEAP